jgi:hypothetical protein
LLLAQRHPRPDVPPLLEALPPHPSPVDQLAPGPGHVGAPPPARVAPLAPQRFTLQLTIGQATHDKLRRAQALLRHRVPSGSLDQVLGHALDSLERQKFAATERPRTAKARAATCDPRRVPNEVKRAVHARDGEQCAFVSEDGERCTERGSRIGCARRWRSCTPGTPAAARKAPTHRAGRSAQPAPASPDRPPRSLSL